MFAFAIIVSSVLITGAVAAVGTYPRLVLRDSQPITDRQPISKRGTSETASETDSCVNNTQGLTAKYTFCLSSTHFRAQNEP